VYGLEELEAGESRGPIPAEKVRNGSCVGCPGIWVSDVGGEELDKAPGCFLPGKSDLTRDGSSRLPDDQLIFHDKSITSP
jgi:hypothetical protein